MVDGQEVLEDVEGEVDWIKKNPSAECGECPTSENFKAQNTKTAVRHSEPRPYWNRGSERFPNLLRPSKPM